MRCFWERQKKMSSQVAEIQVQVITPEQLVFEDKVAMVVLPGLQGEFSVLNRHSYFVSPLISGVVRLIDKNNNMLHAFEVSGGFADVTPHRCTILADSCQRLEGALL